MVIAFRDFRDVEYFIPRDILEAAGFKIATVSNKRGTAVGADGGEAEVDLLASEVNARDFDALLFVGGSGMGKSLDNQDFQKIAQDFAGAKKILAAICIAPALLAKAGVLRGKKATVWSDSMNKSPINMLKEAGAVYKDQDVVVDGRTVTARGPSAASEFGKALIDTIKA